MAVVLLNRAWINLMASGAAVSANSAPAREEEYQVPGEVRTYANGRRRSITRAGEEGKYTVTLLLLTRAQVDTLRSWLGLEIQARDNRGRRFVGVCRGIAPREVRDRDRYHCTVAIDVVTAAEA